MAKVGASISFGEQFFRMVAQDENRHQSIAVHVGQWRMDSDRVACIAVVYLIVRAVTTTVSGVFWLVVVNIKVYDRSWLY